MMSENKPNQKAHLWTDLFFKRRAEEFLFLARSKKIGQIEFSSLWKTTSLGEGKLLIQNNGTALKSWLCVISCSNQRGRVHIYIFECRGNIIFQKLDILCFFHNFCIIHSVFSSQHILVFIFNYKERWCFVYIRAITTVEISFTDSDN